MKLSILAVAALLLSGCASMNSSSRIAVLQNPETKQTVECRVNPAGGWPFGEQVDTCIKTYQKAGYKVVSDSGNEI